MDKIKYIIIFCLLISACLSTQNEQNKFDWLTGSWQGNYETGNYIETWEKNNNGILFGVSCYIENTDTIFKEKLLLEYKSDSWVYTATVGSKEPVPFRLIKSENNKWIFENKEHDFPQRIIYDLKENNKLNAWIEGEIDGKFSKEEFPMTRAEDKRETEQK
jgi:hypothetical protein